MTGTGAGPDGDSARPDEDGASFAQRFPQRAQLVLAPLLATPWWPRVAAAGRVRRALPPSECEAVLRGARDLYAERAAALQRSDARPLPDDLAATLHAQVRQERAAVAVATRPWPVREAAGAVASASAVVASAGAGAATGSWWWAAPAAAACSTAALAGRSLVVWSRVRRTLTASAATHEREVEQWLGDRLPPHSTVVVDLRPAQPRARARHDDR